MQNISTSTIALASNRRSMETTAQANGMTIEQVAASQYLQSMASKISISAKAVLADQASAMDALSRVAAVKCLDETNDERVARINMAILSK